MAIKYSLDEKISNKIKTIIEEYNGGEIFFGCMFLENGNIEDIEPICYGNDEAVLAPYEIVQKFNAILHNHPSGNIKPSSADLDYASYLQQEGIGFFIIDNEGLNLNTVVPPIINKKKIKLDIEPIKKYFSPGGKINNLKNDYEFREGQLQMACKVAESFNEDKIAIIEAGTGIGKSLAYLIPAFLWVEKNQERIVISTNTINLQSQLLNNDIPIVKKILNSKIEAMVVKGRRNYLCKLKLYNFKNELEFDEETEELNSILKWSATTKNGVIDELNFVPSNSTWDKVSSDMDFCIRRHCVFFQDCFFQAVKRKASESNILIVNHHILFADISIRSQGKGLDENSLLPPYRKIIFDEAHNIEKSASSFFSISFLKNGFYKFLSYIRSKNDKGFLPRLLKRLQNEGSRELSDIADFISNEVLNVFSFLFYSSFDIFNNINPYLHRIIENKNYNNNYKINIQYRIKKDEWESEEFKNDLIHQLKDLALKIEELEKSFNMLSVKFDKCPAKLKAKYEIDIKLLKSYQNKLISIQENLVNLLNIKVDEYVTWIEIFGEQNNLSFRLSATPLHIEKLLCQHVYEIFDSIIFSSATLTVNKTFDFFKITTGLSIVKNKQIIEDSIDSPFNYKKNVLFVAPVDIPEPNNPSYNEKINDFLKKTVEATNGSSFILFTSYSQLKKSYEEVYPYLKEKGLRSLYQGEMEKSKLLEKFINEVDSNLFATNSFWEGVDAPGKTLRYVVLAKLPFRMPTEPIEEAKIEDMEKRGINPFITYTLPSAVIRFRQGFGRLIRKKSDYGIVAILDSRVLKKFYGKLFLKSLPQCKFASGNIEQVLESIKTHINECERT